MNYKIWYYGNNNWIFSNDCGLFINQANHAPPNAYCLGDRYIHCDSGIDSYGIVWRGSSCENWHGYNFNYDLGAAIRWVHGANYKHFGCLLWSENNNENKNKLNHTNYSTNDYDNWLIKHGDIILKP